MRSEVHGVMDTWIYRCICSEMYLCITSFMYVILDAWILSYMDI